jgi:AcrR family transcriptional regulator
MPKPPIDNPETRQRLLEAAGEIFAEHGFRNTTVRDICRRAGANIAAVNYHFRDKQGLYTEVLRYAHGCSKGKYPTLLGLTDSAPAPQRLKAFVRSFLLRVFDEGQLAWHGKLVAREMVEPTAALDAIVNEEIRPRAIVLEKIVRDLLGPAAPPRQVIYSAWSIVAQCLFYHNVRPVIQRLAPRQRFAPADIEDLADHITRFSLAALTPRKRKRKGAA